jgi:hypothetical protein
MAKIMENAKKLKEKKEEDEAEAARLKKEKYDRQMAKFMVRAEEIKAK